MKGISSDETTARFLTQSNQFSRLNLRIKPGVFVPHAARLDLSISRVSGLLPADIWPLGTPVAAMHGGKLYGYAELPVSAFMDLGLDVIPDEPPPHHANVKGWPPRREEQLLLAQKLAGRAKLILKD